jgi:hypothetical protein
VSGVNTTTGTRAISGSRRMRSRSCHPSALANGHPDAAPPRDKQWGIERAAGAAESGQQ